MILFDLKSSETKAYNNKFAFLRFMIQDCNFLMTKIPGGNKTICRNKAGKIQEYTNKFTETGALQV